MMNRRRRAYKKSRPIKECTDNYYCDDTAIVEERPRDVRARVNALKRRVGIPQNRAVCIEMHGDQNVYKPLLKEGKKHIFMAIKRYENLA